MVTKEELREVFLSANIGDGDLIFVHSDASPFLGFGKTGTQKNMEILKQAFLEVIGPSGTLIAPTFNYDFCQGKKYIQEETPSQVGLFSNFLLHCPEALRSFHPIYSAVAFGRQAGDLAKSQSKSSFGNGSLFHWLHEHGAKLVFFNVDFYYCTFVHYAEQFTGVDYRFLKHFTGIVSKGGAERSETFDFYARYLDRDVNLDLNKLEKDLLAEKQMKKAYLKEEWPVRQVSSDAVFKMILEKLKIEPYYLLKNPPKLKDLAKS